jgi:hypothetical protein
VDRRERERILGEYGVRDDTVRGRAERRWLELDAETNPLRGRPLRQRIRNHRIDPHTYVAALGGPLPYMVRLRTIEEETAAHEARLAEEWSALAAECFGDATRFARVWRETAGAWNFVAVNILIEKHNRWFPAEARLPMDPRTGDFVLVGGRPYRREPLGEAWVLERFPPELAPALAAAA